mgnify:CR=1 FL=1
MKLAFGKFQVVFAASGELQVTFAFGELQVTFHSDNHLITKSLNI